MNKSNPERLHPHCVMMPDNISFLLYYITRILGKPVFARTELSLFRTPLWWKWIKDNNLPPSMAGLMNGTLEASYGLKMEDADPEKTDIKLADDSAVICEQWVAGWREQCVHRSYRQHDATEYRSLIPN